MNAEAPEPTSSLPPVAEYRFLFDGDFLTETLHRWRKQIRGRWLRIMFKAVLALLCLALAAIVRDVRWVSVFFLALAALMLVSHRFDIWLARRKFRKSPYRNENVVLTLTEESFLTVTSKSDGKLTWAAFTKARRFSDGFLIFQGPSVFNWLPDSALTQGTREEIESLLQSRIEDYECAG